jgi:hypothetical protein
LTPRIDSEVIVCDQAIKRSAVAFQEGRLKFAVQILDAQFALVTLVLTKTRHKGKQQSQHRYRGSYRHTAKLRSY